MNNKRQPVVVIVLDGVSALQLGPYGNGAVATPHWNRLAAESMLFEFCWSDSLTLESVYHSYWTGRTPHSRSLGEPQSLAAICQAHQIPTRLITDAAAILSHPDAKEFGEIVLIETDDVDQAAEVIEETQLLQFAVQTADILDDDATLTWIHSRALVGPWDAPFELRENFVDDEEDPEPPDFVAPPECLLPRDPDPDLLWGMHHAYVAQLCVADMALGMLLDAVVDKMPNAIIVVTAPRGYALGAHQFVGVGKGPLFGDQLHVPCLIRFPDNHAAGTRITNVIQPTAIFPTLLHALAIEGQPSDDSTVTTRPTSLLRYATEWLPSHDGVARSFAEGERAVRTASWYLRQRDATEEHAAIVELYVKPDDRWELNEIANRCPDEVRQLSDELGDLA